MNLHRLHVLDFRLESCRTLDLEAGWIAFTGPNGCGKTNLLDAIHFLCLGRSYFTRQDTQLVRFGQRGFRIEGHFQAQNSEGHSLQEAHVTVVYKPGTPKELALDDVPYKRLSEHLGKFPAVMVTPGDLVLIEGGSTERRKWLDMMLARSIPTMWAGCCAGIIFWGSAMPCSKRLALMGSLIRNCLRCTTRS
ncbi:MAG: AAA family ATPase [Bacteroidota bacterium]